MGLKSFSRRVNELADKKHVNFDSKKSGVHIHNEKKICKKGYRLFDGILIDWRGKIVKKFDYRHLSLISNGKYFAQKSYEKKPWGMFDLNGKMKWKVYETIHHEIVMSPNNTVMVFSAKAHEYKGKSVDFDSIKEYDLKGKLVSTWSSWEHLKELQKFHKRMPLDSPKAFKFVLKKRARKSPWGGEYGFYYHINSLNFIPKNSLEKKDKRFREGNWILSCRHGSIIFIIDRDSGKPVYSITQNDVRDKIEGQHTVQMLENGNLLLFDNGMLRRKSRILEIDPISKEIRFEYEDENFFSEYQGSVQKLPNGNYLIAEGESGRVFEITKNKELVWEYFHPEKQNKSNSMFPQSFGKRQVMYRISYMGDQKVL